MVMVLLRNVGYFNGCITKQCLKQLNILYVSNNDLVSQQINDKRYKSNQQLYVFCHVVNNIGDTVHALFIIY
jgi:hypothetical protein